MIIRVFIQNEAGSTRKHYHDEKTLGLLRVAEVSQPYPYPHGFILGTTAADDCNVDCYVITSRPLRTGDIVDCEPIGLMEQVEDGREDHNVLARLVDEAASADEGLQITLADFSRGVFAHVPEKRMTVGRFLGPEAATAHITAHRDRP
jgi:inorganic pyrophosphatase